MKSLWTDKKEKYTLYCNIVKMDLFVRIKINLQRVDMHIKNYWSHNVKGILNSLFLQ